MVCHSSGAGCIALFVWAAGAPRVVRSSLLCLPLSLPRLGRSSRRAGLILSDVWSSLPFEAAAGRLVFCWLRSDGIDCKEAARSISNASSAAGRLVSSAAACAAGLLGCSAPLSSSARSARLLGGVESLCCSASLPVSPRLSGLLASPPRLGWLR